jgi:hypothetical protein
MITRNDTGTRFFPVPHAWRSALPMLAAVACLGGCATTGPALYANEEFSSADTYSHSFPGSGPATCEAARRALLSQGYIVTESKPALVKGIKNFQRTSEAHAEIEFSVVCAETISAKKFYDQFFSRVESYLDVPAVEKPAAQVRDAAPPVVPATTPATVPAASPPSPAPVTPAAPAAVPSDPVKS